VKQVRTRETHDHPDATFPTDQPHEAIVKHWTEFEIERLKYLAAKGLTSTIIAARLGRTRGSVLFKARKTGIRFTSGRPPKPVGRSEMVHDTHPSAFGAAQR
jgi:hypothetical protein